MEKRLISKTFFQGRGGGVVDSTETYRRASWQGQRLVRCSNRRGYNGEYISVTGHRRLGTKNARRVKKLTTQ